ncbi:MAG TPA: DUF1345 domain-containing protein [Leptolyngbyaceae cyanobacterium M65_K2018_010]|nr:DUF1345 domain-containing protein [Leptolyngbyaceae cyanobacterium M65_K2018_010]
MNRKPAGQPMAKASRRIGQLVVALIVLGVPMAWTTRLVLAFLAAMLTGILAFYFTISRFDPGQLVALRRPDPLEAFVEALVYTLGSFGVLLYLAASEHSHWHFALGFLAILGVWFMVQLIYSQEYALRYYTDGGGLNFPDCPQPQWTEFLYQGFCMAACYQTSDTSVTSRSMRQLITTHGILSYSLSVSIIAMMFGLVGNLL